MKNLIITLLLFFITSPINAAHIVGGDMTYECLGNGDYRIILKIYRDCFGNGAGFDGPLNGAMSIYQGNSQVEFDRITMPEPTIEVIENLPSNPCLILPDDICIEEGTYDFVLSNPSVGGINLPISNESYYLIYQRCCRNNNISNIINPGETGITHYTEITPVAQSECNIAPRFEAAPTIGVCVNEEFDFSQAVIETEGDSIVYDFCDPLRGGGTDGWTTPGNSADFTGTNPNPDAPPPYASVSFIIPNYAAPYPLGLNSTINLDPMTGEITGFPTEIGRFEMAICVKEYRDGVLLSELKREIQLHVIACDLADIQAGFDPMQNDSAFLFQDTSSGAITYLWDFGDGNFSTEASPNHIYVQNGSYQVTQIVFNQECDLSDTITQVVDYFTSSNLNLEETKVAIFPNPSDGTFFVDIKNEQGVFEGIELWNDAGQLVKSFSRKSPNQTKVEIRTELSGVYYVKIIFENKTLVKRVVIR